MRYAIYERWGLIRAAGGVGGSPMSIRLRRGYGATSCPKSFERGLQKTGVGTLTTQSTPGPAGFFADFCRFLRIFAGNISTRSAPVFAQRLRPGKECGKRGNLGNIERPTPFKRGVRNAECGIEGRELRLVVPGRPWSWLISTRNIRVRSAEWKMGKPGNDAAARASLPSYGEHRIPMESGNVELRTSESCLVAPGRPWSCQKNMSKVQKVIRLHRSYGATRSPKSLQGERQACVDSTVRFKPF